LSVHGVLLVPCPQSIRPSPCTQLPAIFTMPCRESIDKYQMWHRQSTDVCRPCVPGRWHPAGATGPGPSPARFEAGARRRPRPSRFSEPQGSLETQAMTQAHRHRWADDNRVRDTRRLTRLPHKELRW
jgi:hypothetical protein